MIDKYVELLLRNKMTKYIMEKVDLRGATNQNIVWLSKQNLRCLRVLYCTVLYCTVLYCTAGWWERRGEEEEEQGVEGGPQVYQGEAKDWTRLNM